jgi:hypothetical protein
MISSLLPDWTTVEPSPLLSLLGLVIQFLILPIPYLSPLKELLPHHPIPQEPYDQDYFHAKGVISCDSVSEIEMNWGSTITKRQEGVQYPFRR